MYVPNSCTFCIAFHCNSYFFGSNTILSSKRVLNWAQIRFIVQQEPTQHLWSWIPILQQNQIFARKVRV